MPLEPEEETREVPSDREYEAQGTPSDPENETLEVPLDPEEGTQEVSLDPKEETREVPSDREGEAQGTPSDPEDERARGVGECSQTWKEQHHRVLCRRTRKVRKRVSMYDGGGTINFQRKMVLTEPIAGGHAT